MGEKRVHMRACTCPDHMCCRTSAPHQKCHGAAETAGHGCDVVLGGPQGKKRKGGPEPEVIATGEAVVTERKRTPRASQVMVSLKYLLLGWGLTVVTGHTPPEGLRPMKGMDLTRQNSLQACALYGPPSDEER